MIIFTERLNLTITIAGAICCLVPATLLTSQSDGIFRDNSGAGAGANRSPVLVGFLFVVLIPASDLILNLLSRAAILLNPNKSTTQTKCSAVTGLTETERLLFMSGMAIQSITWFLPDGTNLNTIGVLDVCLHGCSRILLMGPIILFLQRCTVCWTGFRTFLMLFIGSLGTMAIICNSVLNFNELDSAILSQSGTAFQYTAIAIYLYVIASSVITYSAEEMFNWTTRRVCFAQLFSLIASTASTEYTNKDDKELYTNYIPGLHILFAIILSAADAYESNYTGDAIGEKHVTAVSISFFAQIIVLVMELRIRNCEVARGLAALLHDKKMYVRYVSHELRTPLNTAVLGLQLLLKAPNRNRTVRDRERYDILCDVSESCSAAVTVLDGLLDFDKMQHGLLKLNKSDEVVKTFLEGAIVTFADEAKESNITLNFQMSESSEDTQSQSHPPLPSPLPHPLSPVFLSVSTPVPVPLPIPFYVTVPPSIPIPTLIPPAAMDRDASSDCALPNHLASNYLNADSNNGFSLAEQVANVSGNIGTNRGRGEGRVRDGDRGSDVCASASAGNITEGESTYSRYLPTGWMNHSRPPPSCPPPPPLSILLPLLPHDTVSIDKTKIGQVIKGLISNALKFTTSGGCVLVRTFFLKYDVPDNVESKPKGQYLRSFPTPCYCRKAPRTKLCKWKTNMNRSRVMHCPNSFSRPSDVQTCPHLFPSRDDEGPQYGRLVITVSDTGCGLSAEKVKKFSSEKMMFNLEELGVIDDIGIGFHISRGILGLHGGTISVTSEGVGRGCTFRVELPMVKTPPPLSRPQSSPESQSQSPSRYHPHSQSPPRHQSLSHANSHFPSTQNYKYTHTHPLHTDARPHNNCTSVHPHDAQADISNLEDSSRNRDRAEVLSTDAFCAMKSDCESSCETMMQESLPSHLENENVNVTPRLNVLIVDDSALNRKMLLKILVKEGHTCREACDGQAAVDIMKQQMQRKSERAFVSEAQTVTEMGREGEKERASVRERGRGRGGNGLLDYLSSDDKPPSNPFSLSPSRSPCQFNVILMDYVMPIMDGPTATSVIRDLGYRGPIFGVTGNGLPSDIAHFIACGADRILLKPLCIAAFSAAMLEFKMSENEV